MLCGLQIETELLRHRTALLACPESYRFWILARYPTRFRVDELAHVDRVILSIEEEAVPTSSCPSVREEHVRRALALEHVRTPLWVMFSCSSRAGEKSRVSVSRSCIRSSCCIIEWPSPAHLRRVGEGWLCPARRSSLCLPFESAGEPVLRALADRGPCTPSRAGKPALPSWLATSGY